MSITRSYFFDDKDITDTGTVVGAVFRGNTDKRSGTINQIIIEQVSGAALTVSAELRYIQDDSSITKLVYQTIDADLDLIDSGINAPFYFNTYDNLYLWVQPDATATFNIRIDVTFD